jgi:glycosyltransferase involved in cell wall biosynthesis
MTSPPALAPAAPAATTAAAASAVATMAPLHRLSIVVPMYNEIENAAPLIDAVQAALASYPSPWELIVVDDGSRDGTGDALARHAATVGPHIHVVRLARNFRQTAAMQAGIDAARGDVIVTMDGDLQNDPADIPKLVDKLIADKLDMVAGWREKRQDGWVLRKVPSWFANRLIRRVTGLEFHDLGCSLKAFRASVLKQVRLYGEMHRFIPAWLATVTSPDRMGEVPVRHHARLRGTSKYGISRTLRVVVDILSIYFFLNFGSRPGHFFGVIGLAVTSLGGAMLGYLAVLKLMGESIGGRPLLMLGFFCFIGGLQFLMTGVLAELLVRVYFDGNHARSYTALPAVEPIGAEGGWSRP